MKKILLTIFLIVCFFYVYGFYKNGQNKDNISISSFIERNNKNFVYDFNLDFNSDLIGINSQKILENNETYSYEISYDKINKKLTQTSSNDTATTQSTSDNNDNKYLQIQFKNLNSSEYITIFNLEGFIEKLDAGEKISANNIAEAYEIIYETSKNARNPLRNKDVINSSFIQVKSFWDIVNNWKSKDKNGVMNISSYCKNKEKCTDAKFLTLNIGGLFYTFVTDDYKECLQKDDIKSCSLYHKIKKDSDDERIDFENYCDNINFEKEEKDKILKEYNQASEKLVFYGALGQLGDIDNTRLIFKNTKSIVNAEIFDVNNRVVAITDNEGIIHFTQKDGKLLFLSDLDKYSCKKGITKSQMKDIIKNQDSEFDYDTMDTSPKETICKNEDCTEREKQSDSIVSVVCEIPNSENISITEVKNKLTKKLKVKSSVKDFDINFVPDMPFIDFIENSPYLILSGLIEEYDHTRIIALDDSGNTYCVGESKKENQHRVIFYSNDFEDNKKSSDDKKYLVDELNEIKYGCVEERIDGKQNAIYCNNKPSKKIKLIGWKYVSLKEESGKLKIEKKSSVLPLYGTIRGVGHGNILFDSKKPDVNNDNNQNDDSSDNADDSDDIGNDSQGADDDNSELEKKIEELKNENEKLEERIRKLENSDDDNINEEDDNDDSDDNSDEKEDSVNDEDDDVDNNTDYSRDNNDNTEEQTTTTQVNPVCNKNSNNYSDEKICSNGVIWAKYDGKDVFCDNNGNHIINVSSVENTIWNKDSEDEIKKCVNEISGDSNDNDDTSDDISDDGSSDDNRNSDDDDDSSCNCKSGIPHLITIGTGFLRERDGSLIKNHHISFNDIAKEKKDENGNIVLIPGSLDAKKLHTKLKSIFDSISEDNCKVYMAGYSRGTAGAITSAFGLSYDGQNFDFGRKIAGVFYINQGIMGYMTNQGPVAFDISSKESLISIIIDDKDMYGTSLNNVGQLSPHLQGFQEGKDYFFHKLKTNGDGTYHIDYLNASVHQQDYQQNIDRIISEMGVDNQCSGKNVDTKNEEKKCIFNNKNCCEYSKNAVNQVEKREGNCNNLGGDRWDEKYDTHYNWCKGDNITLEQINNETKIRNDKLKKCKSDNEENDELTNDSGDNQQNLQEINNTKCKNKDEIRCVNKINYQCLLKGGRVPTLEWRNIGSCN